MAKISILTILFITVTLLTGCAIARRATYPAPRVEVSSPPPQPLQEVVLNGKNWSAVCWIRRWEPSNDSTPVLLFFHGNGENLQTMLRSQTLGALARLGAHYIVMDYPGYGRSRGAPSESTVVQAADSCFMLMKQQFVKNPRFVCGWSMGAAVALRVASMHAKDIRGVIAVSPWTSLRDVASLRYPRWMVDLLVKDRYATLDYIASVAAPTLVIHGERDDLIPCAQGKKVSDHLPALKEMVLLKGTAHNDILSRTRTWEEIAAFIRNPLID